LSKAVLAKVKDFSMLPYVENMCKSQGFLEVECRFVGGMWIMIELPTKLTCYNFRCNEATRAWFDDIREWSRNFVCHERLVWLDIEGVPLKAWSKSNFTKVASIWGDVVHMDDNLGINLAVQRLCLVTNHMEFISKEIPVMVEDDMFLIRVKEAAGWSPSFKVMEKESEVGHVDDVEENEILSDNSHNRDKGDECISDDPFELRDLILKESIQHHKNKKNDPREVVLEEESIPRNDGTKEAIVVEKYELPETHVHDYGNDIN